MAPDRETIIRLSVVVERLREQVKEAEDLLARRKTGLDEALAKLDAALAKPEMRLLPGFEGLTTSDVSPRAIPPEMSVGEFLARRRAGLSAASDEDPIKTITEHVRDFFRDNPTEKFSPMEVHRRLQTVPHANHNAVRQAIKRLYDQGFVVRLGGGEYVLGVTSDNASEDEAPDFFGLTDGGATTGRSS